MKLDRAFYTRENVVQIAKDLLGKVIFSLIDDKLTGGVIIETEAYAGVGDRASHAYGNRRTERTETMYQNGGIAYIYLCYGVHHLFNFVTNKEGIPHAVLLRGIIPLFGLNIMERRTGKHSSDENFSDGPGKLTKAMGIDIGMNGTDLINGTIWVEDRLQEIDYKTIVCGPRIGVQYAGKDAHLPYRFLLKGYACTKKNLPKS